MENKELHHKKVAILSRLIKESSLTLEEALLLLKTEDVHQSVHFPVQQPVWTPGTTTPYIQPYLGGTGTFPLTGTISTTENTIAINTTGVTTTTTAFPSNSTFTADLNN